MTTPITTFNFSPGLTLRTVTIDGEPWFLAKDVCDALGFDTRKVGTGAYLQHLDEDEKQTLGSAYGGTASERRATIINECGLYSLILKSRMPEAKAFKKWVTSEVLPAIRKTGM